MGNGTIKKSLLPYQKYMVEVRAQSHTVEECQEMSGEKEVRAFRNIFFLLLEMAYTV